MMAAISMTSSVTIATTTTTTPPLPLPRRRRRKIIEVQYQRPQQESMMILLLLMVMMMCLCCSSSNSNSSFQPKAVVVAYGFQLSPSTPPIEVLRQQLLALQNDDMAAVYRYASPKNKLQVGGSLERFQTMIKSPNSPYRPLVKHIDAQILMESDMMESKQFLVRIINTNKNKNNNNINNDNDNMKNNGDDNEEDDEDEDDDDDDDDDSLLSLSSRSRGDDDDGLEQTYDYWWSMSKCQGGEFDGSFMVDAVFPNFG